MDARLRRQRPWADAEVDHGRDGRLRSPARQPPELPADPENESLAGNVLDGNSVSNCATNGFGVWTFAPYVSPTVQNNTITNCAVGLSAFGQEAPARTAFVDNEVDGTGLAGSTGVYVTTSLTIFGSSDVSATFSVAEVSPMPDAASVATVGGAGGTALVTATPVKLCLSLDQAQSCLPLLNPVCVVSAFTSTAVIRP